MNFKVSKLVLLFLFVSFALMAAPKKKSMPLTKELRKLKILKMILALQNAIEAEKLKKKLRVLSAKQKLLTLKNRLLAERNKKFVLEMQLKKQRQQSNLLKIKMQISRLSLEKAKHQYALSQLRTDLALRKKKAEWDAQVNKKRRYMLNPYKNGVLYISDRRIALNGPIIFGVANYVTKRIHYYNNKSIKHPIFLVIDRCPGGSVMEGYRIVKAMHASKAPVYVVVKSFAASMAAVITTLAKRSYAYPNAVILHHQMSTVNWGNMTMLKEQLKIAKEWERRLMLPVARKMGITVKRFVKLMYKHNSRGDWEEFADRAKKLRWVNVVVKGIKELSFIKKPSVKSGRRRRRFFFSVPERRDAEGRRFIVLPRLSPFDYYFIYNPDRYYR